MNEATIRNGVVLRAVTINTMEENTERAHKIDGKDNGNKKVAVWSESQKKEKYVKR